MILDFHQTLSIDAAPCKIGDWLVRLSPKRDGNRIVYAMQLEEIIGLLIITVTFGSHLKYLIILREEQGHTLYIKDVIPVFLFRGEMIDDEDALHQKRGGSHLKYLVLKVNI